MLPVIAIFDIGKTNKKFFLFNEDYKIVEEFSVTFQEVEDEDGFACDDIEALSNWVISTLDQYLQNDTYDIKAINFSAYGASFVHIDQSGNPVAPLYNYLKPYKPATEELFYQKYGSRESIAVCTASPALGNLNSGLQLFSLKYDKNEVYEKTELSIHFPQYLSYLISKKPFSEITSIGCHTALWDFSKNQYHHWVAEEGIDQKLPPVHPSNAAIKVNYKGSELQCGVGLHDSSSAFIPYIQNIKEPFLLISTGTWCISMNAFNNTPLTKEELEQDCLCYLTYSGATVKSSRLFAGYAHEQAIKKLADHFDEALYYFDKITFDKELLKEEEELTDLLLFDPANYNRYEEGYLNFIKQVVIAQKKSTSLVLNDDVKQIYVDGGFAKNEKYMHLLAEAFPDKEVYAASVSQATAIGAALAIHNDWNEKELPSHIVVTKRY